MNPSTPPPLPSTPPPFKPPVTPPLPAQSESIRLVLDNNKRKTGVFSSQAYRLLVTETRLLFIAQTKNNINYAQQDPAVSLVENPLNFAIPLDELKVIETYVGNFDDNAPDSIIVKTLSDKIAFTVPSAYSVKDKLKKLLGDKVK